MLDMMDILHPISIALLRAYYLELACLMVWATRILLKFFVTW